MSFRFAKFMAGQKSVLNRLEAFSDGVFAIVITLLVLELRVPEVHDSASLYQGLYALIPKFLSFGLSFVYITIYWINHHQLFNLLKNANRGLFWLNNLFLMCLTFIPFPTALIGSYPKDPVAVKFYGWAMFATAVSFVAMKCYSFSVHELHKDRQAKPKILYLIAGPLSYIAAVILSEFNTALAIGIYIAIPVLYFFAEGVENR